MTIAQMLVSWSKARSWKHICRSGWARQINEKQPADTQIWTPLIHQHPVVTTNLTWVRFKSRETFQQPNRQNRPVSFQILLKISEFQRVIHITVSMLHLFRLQKQTKLKEIPIKNAVCRDKRFKHSNNAPWKSY